MNYVLVQVTNGSDTKAACTYRVLVLREDEGCDKHGEGQVHTDTQRLRTLRIVSSAVLSREAAS